MTPSQERACQRFWGSQLTAVQGPPGTGKATLILNALAATVVQKVMTLRDGGAMSDAITVVSSTNNQAVDNVVNPLTRDWPQGQLPLALRVGSREVIEKISESEKEKQKGVGGEEGGRSLASGARLFCGCNLLIYFEMPL